MDENFRKQLLEKIDAKLEGFIEEQEKKREEQKKFFNSEEFSDIYLKIKSTLKEKEIIHSEHLSYYPEEYFISKEDFYKFISGLTAVIYPSLDDSQDFHTEFWIYKDLKISSTYGQGSIETIEYNNTKSDVSFNVYPDFSKFIIKDEKLNLESNIVLTFACKKCFKENQHTINTTDDLMILESINVVCIHCESDNLIYPKFNLNISF